MRLLVALCAALFACDEGRVQRAAIVTPRTETFTQKSAIDPVDLLFVVDNSKSMAPAQKRLADNVGAFFAWLDGADVDYHIAVTSTDALAGGQFSKQGGVAVVSRATPSPATVLSQNVQLGITGSNREMHVESALLALGRIKRQNGVVPAGNEGFLRANARLGLVFLSDERDASPSIAALYPALRDLKGRGEVERTFLAVIGFDAAFEASAVWKTDRLPAASCQSPTGDQTPSRNLFELAANAPMPALGASICGDFAAALVRIAARSAGLRDRFPLTQTNDIKLNVPCPDDAHVAPVCVRVNGAVVTNFVIDTATNEVVLAPSAIPARGASVEVNYAVYAKNERKLGKTKTEETTQCGTDGDCPAGVKCKDGACHLYCTADDMCLAGFSCGQNGACRCRGDESCAEGQVCGAGGVCQKKEGCTVQADCTAGTFCDPVSRTCLPASSCKLPDKATAWTQPAFAAYVCGPGETCVAGTCAAGCFDDADCPSGQTCRGAAPPSSRGTCQAGCGEPNDCCTGQTCESAQCVALKPTFPLCQTTPCANDDYDACIAAGGTCAVEQGESAPRCYPTCQASADCGATGSCIRLRTAVTVCTQGGNQCTGGRTCSATLERPEGICTCVGDAECADGNSCRDVGLGKYCYQDVGTCAYALSCAEMVGPQLCRDSY